MIKNKEKKNVKQCKQPFNKYDMKKNEVISRIDFKYRTLLHSRAELT